MPENLIVLPKREFATLTRHELKGAAYCRVSTTHEEQQGSLENQIAYYTHYISDKPGWRLVSVYYDRASGTRVSKRPGYQRMLKDCAKGKIEILSAVWIQSHDSSENESPFEYPLKPLFRNRYKHRKRSEQLTQSVTRSIFHKGCIRININQATSSFFLLRRFTS